MKRLPRMVLGIAALLAPASFLHAAPATFVLEHAGKTEPIVISSAASPATKAVAEELTGYLGRITGAEFHVESGDGSRGIVTSSSSSPAHISLYV